VSHAAHPVPSLEKAHHLPRRHGKYWGDHLTWTRLFVVSALADSPDLPQTTQRLLQNQVDIGNAIKPFYGDAAGERLTSLPRAPIFSSRRMLWPPR
jgi:hypothetical protein